MSAVKRRRRVFAFKTTHLLLALVVFSISVAAATTVTSRMNQLALGNEADLKCTPDKDYTCPCGTPKEKCPAKKLPGGKDCPCNDETQGHVTPGKCQAVNICKGQPPGGDGKMPELPKMPEPPKGEPEKDRPPQNPCTALGTGLGNVFGMTRPSGSASSTTYDANGQPCPNSANPFLSGELPGTTTGVSAATSAATTASRFSWSAITRVVQEATSAVANTVGSVVSGAVRTAITTLGGNSSQGASRQGSQSATSTRANDGAPLYYTSPDLNTFGAPKESANKDAGSPGMWDWLKSLMRLNP
ncbi:MAG: hypothetical protein AAB804_00375 [Patescibacteria group bacterium]